LPLNPDDFKTKQGGQVSGLSKAAVQKILNSYGITRVLAEEGGRTSRGSMGIMTGYLTLLNDIDNAGLLDFKVIEKYWVDCIRSYMASSPLHIKLDPSKSLRSIVGELMNAAVKRQKETPGTMYAGAVMQHLVGAKLEIAMPDLKIESNGFSVADSPSGRAGDFLLGDTAIHVTTAPSEALLRKCKANLAKNLRPVVITTQAGVGGARALAENIDLEERLDILEFEQFIATNLYEISRFAHNQRSITIQDLIAAYNRIIDHCETDPSLKVVIG
jgi:hypothetical protein